VVSPGDEVAGVILTKGAADARPLWLFCASKVSRNLTTADCRVPPVTNLAIGHVFLPTDEVFSDTDWSQLRWELYIDDQYIDLGGFGTYDYLLPTMAPSPSLVHEVFMKFKAWDVVLTNLQPGKHTIDGRVGAGSEEYSWTVNLVIEEPAASPSKLQPKDPSSEKVESGCPRTGHWLLRFHRSCRMYG
jgi:hypothetical protein